MKQQSDLNDELLIAFSDSARSLLHSRSPVTRMRQFRHQLPNFDRSMWQEIADAGWTSTLISEDLDGLSLGLEAACAIAQEIGRNPMPEPYLAGAVQASLLLNSLEASSLRDDLLRMIASGEKVIGVAWQTSLSATSQIDHDDLMIKQEGERVTINGTRHWVYPAQADGWLLVCHQAKKYSGYLPVVKRSVKKHISDSRGPPQVDVRIAFAVKNRATL
ncbi:acyl-CoA dehydrogenase family protein [Orrella sp. 11846]|uniref:acyl-CoA dehydrogenase family protein n=1 Tax=Orrella sp. 11846 TaxID=3409913 RepID=UPI003B5CDF47